jgi:hypothetical protein
MVQMLRIKSSKLRAVGIGDSSDSRQLRIFPFLRGRGSNCHSRMGGTGQCHPVVLQAPNADGQMKMNTIGRSERALPSQPALKHKLPMLC